MRINFTKESHNRSLFCRQNIRGASVSFSQRKERASQTSYPKGVLPSVMMSSQKYSFTQSLSFATARIKKMTYGQLNLLEPKVTISYDPHTEDFTISDFYRIPSPDLMHGSCDELIKSLYLYMTQVKPQLFSGFKTIRRCGGWDGGRNGVVGSFTGEGQNHSFLLVSPNVLSSEYLTKRISSNGDIKNAFVIDASFQESIPYQESGYTIKNIYDFENIQQEFSNLGITTLNLSKGTSVPILMSSDKILWRLLNAGAGNGLAITRPRDDGKKDAYLVKDLSWLNPSNNRVFGQDSRVQALFQSLHEKMMLSSMQYFS